MNNFKDQYKDKRWQDKRLQILRRDNWHCRACNTTKVALEVHHLYYDMDAKVWEYENESLVSLCKSCHSIIHKDLKKIAGLIAFKLLSGEIDIIDVDESVL